jgi:hypothetical protein
MEGGAPGSGDPPATGDLFRAPCRPPGPSPPPLPPVLSRGAGRSPSPAGPGARHQEGPPTPHDSDPWSPSRREARTHLVEQ